MFRTKFKVLRPEVVGEVALLKAQRARVVAEGFPLLTMLTTNVNQSLCINASNDGGGRR